MWHVSSNSRPRGLEVFVYTANELTCTKRRSEPSSRLASSRLRVVTTEFMNASGNDFSPMPAARLKITAASLAAVAQSSRDKRLPRTTSIRASRCTAASASRPDSNNTRSSVRGGSVFFSLSAISRIAVMMVDLTDMDSSVIEVDSLRDGDELRGRELGAMRLRLEQSLESQEWLLEPPARNDGQRIRGAER